MELEPIPEGRQHPTRADQQAFERMQASVPEKVLADARVWRNGCALIGYGIGVLIALIGTRLTDTTPWCWRLALTLLLGGGLVLVAVALWMV